MVRLNFFCTQNSKTVLRRQGAATKKEKRAAKKQEPAEAVEQEAPTEQDVVEKNEVVSVRGKYIFIGGLVLTSPIWISLIAAVLVIFGIILAAMIVIDIIIATVMTLAIIIGGLVSACAIIYGVIGILPGAVATYIGLYELGLGLIILGSLIVSGILLHFFVIKVTPLVFRSIYRLTKFLARKIKQLVIFVRKECDKI